MKKRGFNKIWILVFFLVIAFLIVSGFFILHFLKGGRRITTRDIKTSEKIIGLNFTLKERKMMLDNLEDNLSDYEEIRKISIPNHVAPALYFNPVVPGMKFEKKQKPALKDMDKEIKMPENLEDLAFYPVSALSKLIKSRQITSTQLTRMYLKRLKKYGPKLECVITLTEELALEQAEKADKEIASDHYRGPLHGIPWGAKDLLATKGIKTTWGAMPYKDQIIDEVLLNK